MPDTAIIGGTGMGHLPTEYRIDRIDVPTRFGPAFVKLVSRADGSEIVFLSRHGEGHLLPPHEINYRANIAALVELGVTRVFATNGVGSLREDLSQGSIVILDDFIDFTRGRPLSYWDSVLNPAASVIHTDFSAPYCPNLRQALIETASDLNLKIVPTGTYVCTDGPRFESPAEIRVFARMGGDVVGMTGLPEAVFAREAGLCYAAVCIITNLGAGIAPGKLAHAEIVDAMAAPSADVRDLLMAAAKQCSSVRNCDCRFPRG